MKSKKQLEVKLSQLKPAVSLQAVLEQYTTPLTIAAEVLWFAYMHNDIKGKVVADLGCGNGILGLGAGLLGAQMVIFLDSDKASLDIARMNAQSIKIKNVLFLNYDVS